MDVRAAALADTLLTLCTAGPCVRACVRAQIEDLAAKTRDLQLLHVTRDMHVALKDGAEGGGARVAADERAGAVAEMASLEALRAQKEKLQNKVGMHACMQAGGRAGGRT